MEKNRKAALNTHQSECISGWLLCVAKWYESLYKTGRKWPVCPECERINCKSCESEYWADPPRQPVVTVILRHSVGTGVENFTRSYFIYWSSFTFSGEKGFLSILVDAFKPLWVEKTGDCSVVKEDTGKIPKLFRKRFGQNCNSYLCSGEELSTYHGEKPGQNLLSTAYIHNRIMSATVMTDRKVSDSLIVDRRMHTYNEWNAPFLEGGVYHQNGAEIIPEERNTRTL